MRYPRPHQKLTDRFSCNPSKRLIIKINSQAPEAEIYDDFGKIYRRYRAIKRKEVGEFFFNEMDDIVEKLCDDFEGSLKG